MTTEQNINVNDIKLNIVISLQLTFHVLTLSAHGNLAHFCTVFINNDGQKKRPKSPYHMIYPVLRQPYKTVDSLTKKRGLTFCI